MLDTESQNNSISNENKASNWGFSRICLIVFIIIFVYCVSFGPAAYVIIRLKKANIVTFDKKSLASKALFVFYSPHLYVMNLSEKYSNYISWWIELGGPVMSSSASIY